MPMALFPAPHPDDPDFIFENAMFRALADPAARQILETLRRQPATVQELSAHVGSVHNNVRRWLKDLEATGLVLQDTPPIYRLNRSGMERLGTWVARFLD